MTAWQWLAVSAALVVLVYLAFVLLLVAVGRRGDARALARFVPDCAVLFGRLIKDERVPRRYKLLLFGLIGYLASPIDLVPDFIPIAGQLDDAILVGLVLRLVLRGAGSELVADHWPGPPEGLRFVLRLAGRGADASTPC